MKSDTFLELVRLMRVKQKDYFRSRKDSDLKLAKALEKRVDEHLLKFSRQYEQTQVPF